MEWTTARAHGKAAKLVFLLAVLAVGATAYAGPTTNYTFSCITNNSTTNAATGEAQLSMDVVDEGSSWVTFRFNNAGPLASSITDIYFDDGSLPSIGGILDSGSGVAFNSPATPPDLPGGNSISPAFNTTAGLSANSDSPVAPNGVNPDEWVSIMFNLTGTGYDYGDILDDLASGDLRVGIHVQAFPNGGSESFINDPSPVPAPGAILLASLGLASLGWVRQRKILG